MRFSKVLLVRQSVIEGRHRIATVPPMGIGYIAEILENNSVEYDVLDMGLGYKLEDLCRKIDKFSPDLVAISMMPLSYREVYSIFEEVKNRYPKITIVCGGPYVSSRRQPVMEECKAFDLGVVLEGEDTMMELCSGVDYDKILGLMYRKNGQVVFTGERPFRLDLDNIHFPRYTKFELSKYLYKEIGLITSRGCPYQCIFCPVHTAIGRKLRFRSAKSVVDEISYWYNQGYRKFNIYDDNFTFKKERVYEICDLIKKSSLKGLQIRCSNGIRADKVDRDLLTLMKEVGFYRLGYGVECGNNRMLKVLKKGETIEQIEEAIKISCELDYVVELFFLLGSPTETWADIEDSFRLAQKYPVFAAFFYNLIPFPNTELYHWIEKNAEFVIDPIEYLNRASHFVNQPAFVTPELSLADRKRAFEQGQKIERKIRTNYMIAHLRKKFGFFGVLLAKIVMTPILTHLYWHVKPIRKAGQIIRKWAGL